MVIKKLRKRFILINMLLVSIVLIAIFLANIITTSQQVASNSYNFLNEDRRHFDITFKEDDFAKKDFEPKAFPQDIIWLKIAEDTITVLNVDTAPDYSEDYIIEISDIALQDNEIRGIIRSEDLRYSVYRTVEGEYIVGFIDITYEQGFINDQIISSLFIGAGSLFVFFIISFFLSKLIIKPVDAAFKKQRQFISDASHELKTPITVILANTSIILNNKDDKNTSKWVNYIDKEANRMKKLVEDLLFLARLDETEKLTFKTKCNLSDTLYECILPFEPVAFETGVNLNNDIDSNIFVKCNIDQIKRLIMILLDNACKYSPKDESISVVLKSENGKAKLTVHNKGDIIPEEEISKIFDRFYRVDKARERNSNSYGLGLPMAKKIVESHGGEISVTSQENIGTVFTVVLPVANNK